MRLKYFVDHNQVRYNYESLPMAINFASSVNENVKSKNGIEWKGKAHLTKKRK